VIVNLKEKDPKKQIRIVDFCVGRKTSRMLLKDDKLIVFGGKDGIDNECLTETLRIYKINS
jgi:hypothetical protein